MPKCHVIKEWLRYTQGFQPRALSSMKFDGHRISDITQLNFRYFFYLYQKKCDFEITLLTYISSYEELQLEFRNIFVHRLGRKPLGSAKSVWNIYEPISLTLKKPVSATMKINGKIFLTLSHTLTFRLGSLKAPQQNIRKD